MGLREQAGLGTAGVVGAFVARLDAVPAVFAKLRDAAALERDASAQRVLHDTERGSLRSLKAVTRKRLFHLLPLRSGCASRLGGVEESSHNATIRAIAKCDRSSGSYPQTPEGGLFVGCWLEAGQSRAGLAEDGPHGPAQLGAGDAVDGAPEGIPHGLRDLLASNNSVHVWMMTVREAQGMSLLPDSANPQ